MVGRVRVVPMVLALAAAASCGKSEREDGTSPSAGTGGAARTAGASSGGSAAAGGNGAGTGGNGTGAGGNGTGAGGNGGAASGAGALGGVSGAAGCNRPEEVEDSLSHCPPVPGRDGGPPMSSCTLEVTCEALGCGDTWSDFDPQGCLRPYCDGDDDCAAGERCVPETLVGSLGCHSSVFEGCSPECDGCLCGASADCNVVAFCQPISEFPESADCSIRGRSCDQLEDWRRALDTESYDPEIMLALEACALKLDRAIPACSGEGGAAGEGAPGTAGRGG